jgi:hypothetical protein
MLHTSISPNPKNDEEQRLPTHLDYQPLPHIQATGSDQSFLSVQQSHRLSSVYISEAHMGCQ